MKPAVQTRLERAVETAAHILVWAYMFLSPLLFIRSGERIDWEHYLGGCILPLAACIIFYINYFFLIPHCLLQKGRVSWFCLINVLLILAYVAGDQLQFFFVTLQDEKFAHRGPDDHDLPPRVLFILRNSLLLIFFIGMSVAIRLSMKWRQSERARAEAELRRSQAELKNLKNQINPHFLLNTLNNIYALTAFDQDKAQQAIMELSRLLRYMLYENQTDRVSLSKEIEFLKSYIALMRLRIYDKVDVKVDIDVPEDEDIPIAPLIFISLIENAFKHGISPTAQSYVHIKLHATRERLIFICANSNFPKTKADKAPGGIGLKQVAQRLELSYPGRYKWTAGTSPDGREYRSEIVLTDK